MHRRSGWEKLRVRQVEGEKEKIPRGPPRRLTDLCNIFGMGHLFVLEVEGKKPYGERRNILEKRSKIRWRD